MPPVPVEPPEYLSAPRPEVAPPLGVLGVVVALVPTTDTDGLGAVTFFTVATVLRPGLLPPLLLPLDELEPPLDEPPPLEPPPLEPEPPELPPLELEPLEPPLDELEPPELLEPELLPAPAELLELPTLLPIRSHHILFLYNLLCNQSGLCLSLLMSH